MSDEPQPRSAQATPLAQTGSGVAPLKRAFVGGVLGIVGVVCCFVSSQMKDPEPPPEPLSPTASTIRVTIQKTATEKWSAIIDAVKGDSGQTAATAPPVASAEPPSPTPQQRYQEELASTRRWRWWLRLIGGGFGVLALACGVAGYLRHEQSRSVKACIGLGLCALAFEYVMIAVAVFLFLLLLFALM